MSDIVVQIIFSSGKRFLVKLNEERIYQIIYENIGNKIGRNRIMIAEEVSSWASLASVGEIFEENDFTVEILESEKK